MITLPRLLGLSLLGGSMWTSAILPIVLIQPAQDTTPAATASTEISKPATPRPNPDASGKYHVGDGVTAPKLIFSVEPEFSEKAREKKVGGNCVVGLTVNPDGTVGDAKIVHSIADDVSIKLRPAALTLDENALKVVGQYRFEPGTYQGKPVPVALEVGVSFQIF